MIQVSDVAPEPLVISIMIKYDTILHLFKQFEDRQNKKKNNLNFPIVLHVDKQFSGGVLASKVFDVPSSGFGKFWIYNGLWPWIYKSNV
jgi:hypothetical protein